MPRTVRPWNAATPVGYYYDSRTQARVPVFLSEDFARWFATVIRAVQRYENGGYQPAAEFWFDVSTTTGGGHLPPNIEGGF